MHPTCGTDSADPGHQAGRDPRAWALYPSRIARFHAAPAIDFDDVWSDTTNYLTYRDENRTFASIGLWQERSATLTHRGEPQRVRALRVTHGTLQALGIQPSRGRWFTEREHELGAEGPEPVILSHAFWQQHFGGDESVLGRELSIEEPNSSGGVAWTVGHGRRGA